MIVVAHAWCAHVMIWVVEIGAIQIERVRVVVHVGQDLILVFVWIGARIAREYITKS